MTSQTSSWRHCTNKYPPIIALGYLNKSAKLYPVSNPLHPTPRWLSWLYGASNCSLYLNFPKTQQKLRPIYTYCQHRLFATDTFDLFGITCKQHHRTAVNPILNGAKNGDIESTVKTKPKGLFTHNIFSPCLLLPPLKFSIVPIVMVWKMDRMDDASIFSPLFWWQ